MIALLVDNPVLTLFVVAGAGFLVGKLKIGGFSLGVSAVLFTGLAAGIRLVTLTNGSVMMSEGMLSRAGVLELLERRMSVSEASRWKPAAEPYRYAAALCGVPVDQMALIVVHPWDTDGA